MENFVHASVSREALADFAREARAVGVQLHALEIFEKTNVWSAGLSRPMHATISGRCIR